MRFATEHVGERRARYSSACIGEAGARKARMSPSIVLML